MICKHLFIELFSKCFTPIFLLFLFVQTGNTKHIVGGELTYACNGIDTVNEVALADFDFVLNVYRDCYQNGGAQGLTDFDGQAEIGIYRFNGVSWVFLEAPTFTLNGTSPVDPNGGECIIVPENLCVDQGFYNFNLRLPVIDQPYIVAYQRCCRNNSITNLVEPGDAGAIYMVEIGPEAQTMCNNSVVFNEFPPLVICENFEFEFDHSATDIDGDQIIYEFYNPLTGGGPDVNTPRAENPCGVPSPVPQQCLPPFDEVTFFFPNYSENAPVSGAPALSINANTGLITGVPNLRGQFVVGVLAKELRNGVVINEIRRDFQFNVSDCSPVVLASLQTDEVVDGKDYVFNSCGENTIEFINESIREDFIERYVWEFDIDGDTIFSGNRDITVEFPGPGEYQGVMMLNPGSNCADTANIFVNVYPKSYPDFSFDYDTCIAGPVNYTDLSMTDALAITDWDWNFGTGVPNSSQQSPEIQFGAPGLNPVTLSITDNNNCVTDTTITVDWRPVPETIVVAPSSFTGCRPAPIFFNNLSNPIDETYDIEWDFGDGNTSDEISPTHIYEEPGVFSVSLDITSPIGCTTEQSFESWITIDDKPEAQFDFSPDRPTIFNRTVGFFDQSINAIGWQWRIGDESVLFEQNPTYTFQDTGIYEIQLVVRHLSGCTDTTNQQIDILPIVDFHMPNAFTPNNDGKNEEFKGKGFTTSMTSFTMTIWDRWGELVFETDSPDESWNGKKNNVGVDLPQGIYVYVVNYEGTRGEREELKGFATLIR